MRLHAQKISCISSFFLISNAIIIYHHVMAIVFLVFLAHVLWHQARQIPLAKSCHLDMSQPITHLQKIAIQQKEIAKTVDENDADEDRKKKQEETDKRKRT
jgi:hypothetical protein